MTCACYLGIDYFSSSRDTCKRKKMYIFRFSHETKKLLSLVRVEINNLEIQCKLLREIAKETELRRVARRSLAIFPRERWKDRGIWRRRRYALRVRKTILHKSVDWFEIQRSGRKEGGRDDGIARGAGGMDKEEEKDVEGESRRIEGQRKAV